MSQCISFVLYYVNQKNIIRVKHVLPMYNY